MRVYIRLGTTAVSLLLASRFVLQSRHPPKLSFPFLPLGFLNIWSWMITRSIYSKRSSPHSSGATWTNSIKISKILTSPWGWLIVHTSITCLRNITTFRCEKHLPLVISAPQERYGVIDSFVGPIAKSLKRQAHQLYKVWNWWAFLVDASAWWPNILNDV